jgi:hypothetical protein
MTAKQHELARELEAARAREQMYLAEVAARAQMQVAASRPQEPDVDPEFRRQVELAMSPLKQEMSRAIAQLQAQNSILQVRAEATQRGLPDPVKSRAEEITRAYLQQGHVIDKEVAMRMAAGDLYLDQIAKSQASRQAVSQFNQPNPLLTGQGVLPVGQPQAQRPDYDSMSLEERIRRMEADGVGNVPF